ncbi:hypothetical protein FLONG3_2162 [Fusarium longipes]|uniref:Uncharacterized protein n=1 Tax=Fusarium longipes TaxID=694270 RepID=A0A395T4T6_9HYPO|nr:hypothetical protein FLONG3_2162 [Fusarium longipes]
MKLYQVTVVLAFIATGVIATPADFDKDIKSPEKHGDGSYSGKKGDDDYSPGKGHGNDDDDDEDYGRGDKGKKYEWDIERCDWCPYNPKSWLEYEPKGRGYKRPCPEDKKKCQKYAYDYSKATYPGVFSEFQKCSKGDNYKVTGKIGACSGYGKAQCLIVQYEDWEKWSDKLAYLGLYSYTKEGPKDKKYLNFNKYCKKNKIASGLESTMTSAARTSRRVTRRMTDSKKGRQGNAYDDEDAEEYEKRGDGFSRGRYEKVKYVELDIEPKYSKKCAEFCCCA